MRRWCSRRLWLFSQLGLGLSLFGLLAPAWAQDGGFVIGQQVEVSGTGSAINLRDAPGLSSNVITTLPNGTVMTVVGGPQSADGYVWWEIEGGLGRGWSAEGLLRPVSDQTASATTLAEVGCEPSGKSYGGIYYCQRLGDVHVVVVDLNNPHVRFETVLAYDVDTVQSSQQEWVSQMVARYPGAVAAINADYFGENHHGPEGLTIRNGTRLDDLTGMERSALVIGKSPLDEAGVSLPIRASVVRLETVDRVLEPTTYYNAVAGGPQVVFDSTWDWTRGLSHPSYQGCRQNPPATDVINGECFLNTGHWNEVDTRWTAAGITGDQKMIWVVGPFQQISATFAAFDVQTAIKLDGGGSSQLWYDQQTIVQGSRPVADALLVFYLRSARVVEQPQWPIIVENETLTIRVMLENTGAETWRGGDYMLVNEENPWGSELSVALGHDVKPGETVALEWTTDVFDKPGVFTSQWRMAMGEDRFPGDSLKIAVIVMPKQIAEKKAELERKVKEWIEQGVEDIQQRAEEYVWQQLNSICLLNSVVMPILSLLAVGWHLTAKRENTHPSH